MKLITRDSDYAIRALCRMSACGKRIVTVDALRRETRIPRAFLRKILQRLNARGVIRSYKGRGGGFSMSAGPGAIRILDVIRIFQRDVA
ncbi:MAG: Rrf2 family transcriptional regulator, partial [Candidatus Omnitrophota bacterium]